jgi:predicted transcriptional regulator
VAGAGRPTRRRQILDLLRDRPQLTGQIAAHFGTSQIAVMHHLDVLAEAALVTGRKQRRQ